MINNAFHAAANVRKKHEREIAVGHVFHEEEAAVVLLDLFSWVMPTIVAVSSLIDFLLVLLFQKILHPWRRILAKVRKLHFEREVGNQQLSVQENTDMGEPKDAAELETLRGSQSSGAEVSCFSSFNILCSEG